MFNNHNDPISKIYQKFIIPFPIGVLATLLVCDFEGVLTEISFLFVAFLFDIFCLNSSVSGKVERSIKSV